MSLKSLSLHSLTTSMLIRLSSRRQFCHQLLTRRTVGHFQKFENPIPRRRFERTATLKYDPCKDEDFTAYGIVPFFQKQLNDMLLPEDQNSGPIPNYNIKPTDDQRKLLSILKSDHSVVLKGGAQTGKSLSLITYALDAVLSRTPNYKLLRRSGLDSVIIVPTDELVDTYKKYVKDLLHGIPPRCCPDELVPNKVTKEFELTRKPLNVEFLSSKSSEIYSTDGVDGVAGSPQVLVTTFSRINDIIQGKNDSSSLTTHSLLENVKLVAVDETDIFIQTAQMGSESFVGCQGKKKKYFNKLDVMLRKLQSEHIESFRSDLVQRLKLIEGSFETSKREFSKTKGEEGKANGEEMETNKREFGDSRREFCNTNKNSSFKTSRSNFNYTEFILSHNDLSTSNIEEFVENESIKSSVNIELLKKMIRQRRKVLYKPIQFCFIYRAPPPYKEMLNIRASAAASRSLTKAAKQQGEITPSKSNEALHDVYSTYLTEKRKELDSRDEDTTMNFIQKIIRFSDDQRLLREKERRLIAAGGYDPENIGTATTRGTESEFEETETDSIREAESTKASTEQPPPSEPVNVYFPYISTKGKKFDFSVGELDVVKNYPNEINTMELMQEHVTSSRNNVKNMEKIYLKSKLQSRMVETSEKKVETEKKKVEGRSLETPRLSETSATSPDSDSQVLSSSKMSRSSKSKIPSLSRRASRVLEKLFLSIRIQHKIEGPFLVVVPGDVVPGSVAKDLSRQKKFRQSVTDKFEYKLKEVTGSEGSSEESSEGISEGISDIADSKSTEISESKSTDPNSTTKTPISNLIVTPSQLVGQNINFSNVIVLGIESLLPQLAYGAPDTSEIPSVSGTLDPYNDLTQVYLSRLQLLENSSEISKPLSKTSSNSSKNIFYVFDGTSQNVNLRQDLTRFGDMIMYNKLLKGVRVRKMILDSDIRDRRLTVLEYGKR